jgi:hypothetical protein
MNMPRFGPFLFLKAVLSQPANHLPADPDLDRAFMPYEQAGKPILNRKENRTGTDHGAHFKSTDNYLARMPVGRA